MITRAETKHIEGPQAGFDMPRGPELVRMFVAPSIPSGERLRCGSCMQVAIMGHEVTHSKDCPWQAQQPNSNTVKGIRIETK